jgi:Family of unknown function (DUF6152)
LGRQFRDHKLQILFQFALGCILNQMKIRIGVFAIALSVLATAVRVTGHHHIGCIYDTAASQTLAGRIVEIVWQFPHVHIRLDLGGGPADRREWDIETVNPQGLRRDGVQSDTLKVGDMLNTTSWIAKDGSRHAFTQSMTLPAGNTVTFPIADLTCPF